MSFIKKLLGRDTDHRVDYYEEGMALLKAGAFHEALTSFRLALRDAPGDLTILMQIAVTYTRIGMTDEAIKAYYTVLKKDPRSAGARYGLAFLLLHAGQEEEGLRYLREFLDAPPTGPEAARHIEHARRVLAERTEAGSAGAGEGGPIAPGRP